MKEYQIPTHNCTTFRYNMEYSKWFIVTARNLIVEHIPIYAEAKDYIVELIKDMAEILNSAESE